MLSPYSRKSSCSFRKAPRQPTLPNPPKTAKLEPGVSLRLDKSRGQRHEWQARKHGAQGWRQCRKVHLAMDAATSDIRAGGFIPAVTAAAPSCRTCWTGSPKPKTSAPRPQMAPTTPAAATAPSPDAAAQPSSRSARTADRGRRVALPSRRATKPCAPRVTTAVRFGSGGQEPTPAVASKSGDAASSPSADASPQKTPTVRPPNSRCAPYRPPGQLQPSRHRRERPRRLARKEKGEVTPQNALPQQCRAGATKPNAPTGGGEVGRP